MNDADSLQALQRRFDALREALSAVERTSDPGDRERLRQEIVSLFRDTEGLIERLVGLRDGIRPLVERYKALFRTPEGAAPAPLPAQPGTPVRVDHLGSSTYLERGWNAIAGENYELALRELGRALALAPGSTRAETLLGWAQMRLGRYAEARALLEGVLARDPEHGLARANLGYISYKEGDFAGAIEHLSRIVRSSPDRTALLYATLYLGMVYAEREMYRDARAFFERAIEMGPNLIEAYWELGRALFREGRRDLALEIWRRGAQTNRFNPWGERCEQAAARVAAGEAVSFE